MKRCLIVLGWVFLLGWVLWMGLMLGGISCSESKQARYNRQAAKYKECPKCGNQFIYGFDVLTAEKSVACWKCGWKAED